MRIDRKFCLLLPVIFGASGTTAQADCFKEGTLETISGTIREFKVVQIKRGSDSEVFEVHGSHCKNPVTVISEKRSNCKNGMKVTVSGVWEEALMFGEETIEADRVQCR